MLFVPDAVVVGEELVQGSGSAPRIATEVALERARIAELLEVLALVALQEVREFLLLFCTDQRPRRAIEHAVQLALDGLRSCTSSSGRLDVLLRCMRAALLVSHGLRRDVVVYLVLRGGAQAPRVLRVDGQCAKFVRPDERSLAILVKKTLAVFAASGEQGAFVEVRPGLSVAEGDLECVLLDAAGAIPYLLDEHGVGHGEVTDLDGLGISILALRDPDNIQIELTAPTS